MSASPPLQSFNPHAVHYFTSASSSPQAHPLTQAGLPTAVYPSHVLFSATTPPRTQAPPMSSSAASQSAPKPATPQASFAPMQSPQPRPIRGFAVGAPTPAAKAAIFEPFNAKRPVTPELDAVLRKKTSSWTQWELEGASK
ncbi:SubName: Full=Uncharacterized protein {ECO:0000313/EMBL:CCA69822.1} [Serendipita indica DSM 11827]|uniref:Uncharacterized protein n=1 Tax=Serendipita indica (strain DSM 11827) TaxID=1109443 RepID=G4TEU0_SERID|nr:SubName: Full=Uncharacterized protein {ECO:0000313/EMBL:CCA69822.1} [Serendipita indica DSM 11827]CCA69822.1 hypothetical protein PIIN_03762 [Serendipita indica DSM 11827]